MVSESATSDGRGNIKLTRVVIENNFANNSGGAVFMRRTHALRIERSAIVGNTIFGVNSFGPAIEIQGGILTVTDTTISDNVSADQPHAPVINLFGGAQATIRRSTIVGAPSQPLIANVAFGVSTVDLASTILATTGTSCVRGDIDGGSLAVV